MMKLNIELKDFDLQLSSPVDLSGSDIWKETRHFLKIQLNLKFHLRHFLDNTKFVNPIIQRNVPKIVQFKSNFMVSLLITDIKP